MENEQLLDGNISDAALSVNSAAKEYLLQTANWGRFLAVMSIIFSLLIIAIGFAFGSIMNMILAMSPAAAMGATMNSTKSLSIIVSVVYGTIGFIMMYPGIRLLQFSSRTRIAIQTNDAEEMETGMKRLRSVFRFYGIITIIMLVIYALAIVGFVVGMNSLRSM